MQHLTHTARQLYQKVVLVRLHLARNDRGEINSSVAWTGAMVLLAVSIAGVIAAKASGFAGGIDFGG